MKEISSRAFSLIELSLVILVIGVIIAGITQSSRMVTQMKLTTARTLTQSSEINSIKNLVTWLEATSEKSFDEAETTDASIITNWYDINSQTTVKNNAQQSSGTANLHPTYKANCINGLPCVSFNGSTNYIDTLQNLGPTSELSLFVVVQLNTLAGGGEYSFLATSGGWSSGTDFTFKHRSNFIEYQLPNSVSITKGTVAALANYYVEIIDDGTNGTVYKNGSASSASSTGVTKNLGIFNIGSYYNGSSRARYLDGQIGEIILFNRALKAEERLAVENYLSKKWAIK